MNNASKKGVFITFEGLEGAGKSTQVDKLARFFKKIKRKVTTTLEPGGSLFGRKLRKLLIEGGKVLPETELFLFLADRADHVRSVIMPLLKKKEVVICDRFTDSTIAYQVFGRGLPRTLIDGMNKFASGGLSPDVVFFLDLPVQEGLSRIKQRKKLNRMDKEALGFYQKVRKGYYYLARKNKKIMVIDGTQSIDEIHQIIVKKVQELLK